MWQTFIRTWRWSFLGPPKSVLPSILEDENYPSSGEEMNQKNSPESTSSELANRPRGGNPRHNQAGVDAPPTPDTVYDEMDNFDIVTDLVADEDVNRAIDDLMSSYAEFPNLLTEDDMVSSSFPVIKFDEPFSEYPTTSANCFMCPQD
jgi:hypothetical protein